MTLNSNFFNENFFACERQENQRNRTFYAEPVPATAFPYKPDFRYKSSPCGERYTLHKGKLYYVKPVNFLGTRLDFVPVERNKQDSNLSSFDINRYTENIDIKKTPLVVMFLEISKLLCDSSYMFTLKAPYEGLEEKQENVEINRSVKVLHENRVLKILLADFVEVKL